MEEERIFVDPVLYEGSPADAADRPENERACYAFLDGLGISYLRAEHAPAMTIAACEEVDRVLGTKMCKNLFLTNRQQTDFYLLLMPGEKPFKTKDLSGQLGVARLSFASGEHMQRFLDITPGSVSVLGLANDKEKRVRLLIDADLMRDEYLGCHPCRNTASLKIAMRDVLEKFLPATGHDYTVVTL
ncbi:MAG: prolyl-tRNA synthetase associated domain-containing protein [Clostridia bacterium]|nr:prolyl-tRNA synthetase associated domain-containing protein [Clostridia bacterium]